MSLAFSISRRLMSMDDTSWRRHANPWSVYSRMTLLPLFALAVWSRVWIGWWSLAAIACVIAWTWLNPRLFQLPRHEDGWAAKAVQGERIWLEGPPEAVVARHERAVVVLGSATVIGTIVLGWGLVTLNLSATIFGGIMAMGAKLWLVDRMTFVHDAMASKHERA